MLFRPWYPFSPVLYSFFAFLNWFVSVYFSTKFLYLNCKNKPVNRVCPTEHSSIGVASSVEVLAGVQACL